MAEEEIKKPESTLYRKYRPRNFGDVVGQNHVVSVIRNALTEDKVAHAYLFAGPRGVGKTTIARILAKRLNCENPQGAEPCGECSRCQAFARNASLDLVEIDAASNRGIDDIRALKERISLAPTSGDYKVYIVDEVHMLTKEAFNALLKTLEEPPSHAIFILATTELHKVPETIRSRCQAFSFRRAPVKTISERLKKIAEAENAQVDKSAFALIARHSEGCFRDAESLLGQVLSLEEGKITSKEVENLLGITGLEVIQNFIGKMLAKDTRASLELLQQVIERGASLKKFADDITRYLRALASFRATGVHSEALDPQAEETLKKQAENEDTATILKLLRLMLRAKTEMRDAVYEELPLELAVLEWTQGEKNEKQPQPQTEKTEQAREEKEPEPQSSSPPPKKEVADTNTPQTNENAAALKSVLAGWQSFLKKTMELNPLLVSTLQACTPVAVKDNNLYLVTQYTLYKERISDNNVATALEDLLGQICEQKFKLRIVDAEEGKTLGLPPEEEMQEKLENHFQPEENKEEKEEDLASQALSILGGELVS